jgi:hypothetical protein
MLKIKQPNFVKPEKIPDYKIVAGGRPLHFLEIVVNQRRAKEKQTNKRLKNKKRSERGSGKFFRIIFSCKVNQSTNLSCPHPTK